MEKQDAKAKHKNVRMNILRLLEAFPNLTENRNKLVSYYWVFCDQVSNLEQAANATSAETITRNLRKLIELGLVKQPNKKKLKEKEIEFAHEFGSLR